MTIDDRGTNLYDALDEVTRARFLTAIGVDANTVGEETAREILADYDMTAVEEAQAHNFI